MSRVSEAVAIAALELALRPLGTSLKHYMPTHKASAIAAMQGIIDAETDRCVAIAEERAAICADAVARIDAGELYAGIPTARASEERARLEAAHIVRLMRGDDGAPGLARGSAQ